MQQAYAEFPVVIKSFFWLGVAVLAPVGFWLLALAVGGLFNLLCCVFRF